MVLAVFDNPTPTPAARRQRRKQGRSVSQVEVIRIDMIRQDMSHPNKRRRHQGWASCEVAGQRFEAEGPAPIYKLSTLLWFHGHSGADYDVYDNRSPFGKPGGLALRGRVRNWARLVNGKPKFNQDAPSETDFSPHERDLIARAAGRVSGAAEIDSPRPDNARTARSHPLDGPMYPRERDRACTGVIGALTPEAA